MNYKLTTMDTDMFSTHSYQKCKTYICIQSSKELTNCTYFEQIRLFIRCTNKKLHIIFQLTTRSLQFNKLLKLIQEFRFTGKVMNTLWCEDHRECICAGKFDNQNTLSIKQTVTNCYKLFYWHIMFGSKYLHGINPAILWQLYDHSYEQTDTVDVHTKQMLTR